MSKHLYRCTYRLLLVIFSEANYSERITNHSPMMPKKAEEQISIKVGQFMLEQIKYKGQEGYFLSKEQGEQLKNTLQHCSSICEKVIQNADNS